MKPFDLEAAKNGAKVVTRDGRKARIVCFDVNCDEYPLATLIADEGGEEVVNSHTGDGKYHSSGSDICDSDLLMATVKKECWINFYGFIHGCSGAYDSEEMAKNSAVHNVISCIHHTWEE